MRTTVLMAIGPSVVGYVARSRCGIPPRVEPLVVSKRAHSDTRLSLPLAARGRVTNRGRIELRAAATAIVVALLGTGFGFPMAKIGRQAIRPRTRQPDIPLSAAIIPSPTLTTMSHLQIRVRVLPPVVDRVCARPAMRRGDDAQLNPMGLTQLSEAHDEMAVNGRPATTSRRQI